ncbi:MAG: DUF2905 domain-containing protein [Lachnospiraceae bacterium]|nr:DUF2905 domain-containing protein [Lachnospiraceae bacterium]
MSKKKVFLIIGLVAGALLVGLVILWLLIAYVFIRMPFNGDVTFHDFSVYVPEKYVRDSTQSNDALWVYEYQNYTSYILLHKSETADPNADLAAYADYITERGGSAAWGERRGVDVLDVAYTQDNKACRETVFVLNGSLYSVALRGGTEDEFTALRDSITWKMMKVERPLYYNGVTSDDTVNLSEALTEEYEIDALRTYFDDQNRRTGGIDGVSLSFNEVNQQYPIEVFRTGGYSVYKVKEGGYFYVFWNGGTFDPEETQAEQEPSVCFTAYIKDSDERALLKDLRSLAAPQNTFANVKSADPSVYLCLLMSRGTFSYSYIDGDEAAEIEYDRNTEVENWDELVIEKIRVIPRDEALYFGNILAKDLPANN